MKTSSEVKNYNGIAEEVILNTGLTLAMEFGMNWLKPIQARLNTIYPTLSKNELDYFNEICGKCMRDGNEIFYSLAKENGKNLDKDKGITKIKNIYPWIDNSNMNTLVSQSLYYAFKDGFF